jgi:hypothetical protein
MWNGKELGSGNAEGGMGNKQEGRIGKAEWGQ